MSTLADCYYTNYEAEKTVSANHDGTFKLKECYYPNYIIQS